jgi:uncharacterized repeat protein (TIGR01451 family)
LVASLVLLVAPQSANAAPPGVVNILVTNAATGTAPFDATAGPGNDTSAANSIVRTNDSVTYDVNLQAVGAVVNETATLTLANADASWAALPPQCGPGSSINGAVLTCATGDHTDASFSIPVSVRVSGAAANGAPVTVTSSVTADNAPATSGAPLTDTVSALPRYDLTKSFGTAQITGTTRNGVTGYRIDFPITVQGPAGGRGEEEVTAPLTFTDDLSQFYVGQPAGWGDPQVIGCGPNGADGVSVFDLPFGSGTAANQVTDSGTWLCTQSADTATITITGADLSFTHIPTQTAVGGALPANVAIAVAGYVSVFVPVTDLSYAPMNSQAALHNSLTGFAPSSITGQTNYGSGNTEPGFNGTGNNASNVSVSTGAAGTFAKQYGNDFGTPNDLVAPNASIAHDGNGEVTPGQTFTSVIAAANRGGLPITNLSLCDLIDNQLNVVTGVNNVFVNVGVVTGITYEYAAGPPITTPAA